VDDRTAAALRGLIIRGYVESVQDDGEQQTMTVTTHDGTSRSGIPVAQFYGLGGQPPLGAEVLMFALGGDQGDMVALPAFHTGRRMGGFEAGENALYDDEGNRVAIYRGGAIEIQSAAKVLIRTHGCEVVAPAGTKITGNVEIVGDLKVTGQVADATGSMQTMRGQYNRHTNPNQGNNTPSVQMD